MGASNALRVYATWGGDLGDQAMRVLVYMAIVARDNDAEPWFGLGHEALSELALSRRLNGDAKDRDAALRAVRRAVTELQRAGAITTAKRPTNTGRHAHYRLWLDGPSPDAKRPTTPVDNRPADPVDNPPSPDGKRPTTAPVVGRKIDSRRTKNVRHRRTKNVLPHREEELRRQEERINPEATRATANCGRGARGPP